MRIFVCDDARPQDICNALETARENGAEIPEAEKVFGKDELNKAVPELFGAVQSAIKGEKITEHPFDKADLILLDYGLTALDTGSGFRLTADHIAGYLRAFSSAAYIVSLNRLPMVDFDLKHLVGDTDSRADLSLNLRHLEQPGLWHGKPASGEFCPWYWPSLAQAGKRRSEQVDLLLADLERPLLDLLAFPKELDPHLSRQAIGFLSPEATEGEGVNGPSDIRKVTAWDHFRNSSRTLTKDDRRDLVEVRGGDLDGKKRPKCEILDKIIARVVAGELDFWFRRDLLGPQRLLVDAPHLLASFPYRGENELDDPAVWNGTVRTEASPFGFDQGFAEALPDNSKVSMWPWIERPTFWMPLIEHSHVVDQATEALARGNHLCFCEDTREFLPRDDCSRFATELGMGLDVRYVRKLIDFGYSPQSAFSY